MSTSGEIGPKIRETVSNDYVQYLWAHLGTHRITYDTFNFIADLHARQKLNSYTKLLLRLQLLELLCKYIELAGAYSFACRETGLLYPHRVLSIKSNQVASFYEKADKLTNSDILTIFNPKHPLEPTEIQDVKDRYKRIANFIRGSRSLYNALKHNVRVYPLELETKSTPDRPAALYHALNWVHVYQGEDNRECIVAHKWDGTDVALSIQHQKPEVDVIPVDDLTEYRTTMEDCHFIISKIGVNNTPPQELPDAKDKSSDQREP